MSVFELFWTSVKTLHLNCPFYDNDMHRGRFLFDGIDYQVLPVPFQFGKATLRKDHETKGSFSDVAELKSLLTP